MAYYQNTNRQTRDEKRTKAEARGGFEDEGANYKNHFGQQRGGQRRPERGFYGPDRRNENQGYQGKDRGFQGERRGYQGNSDRRPESRSFGGNDRRPEGRGYQGNDRRPEGRSFGNGDRRPEGRSFGNSERRPEGRGYQGNERRPENRGFGRAPQFKGRSTGEVRHNPESNVRYTERGSSVKPRPYHEQRAERMQSEKSYDRFRYESPAPVATPVAVPAEDMMPENLLSGRNPIREALKSGRDVEKLLVARGELSGSAREIVQMAKERRIPVQEVERVRLDQITRNHQGMLAFASAHQYSTVEDMLALAKERNEAPFLVLLDGITDPHNLGAIIRTAECAGAHGVIVQERRAVGLTPAAVKASAGAVEYVPVARVTNLTSTIEKLQAENIWVYAADMDGEVYTDVDMKGAVALVIGAEGEGVGKRVLDTCDKSVSIPLCGKLDSLNASVAAGVLLYTAMRQR